MQIRVRARALTRAAVVVAASLLVGSLAPVPVAGAQSSLVEQREADEAKLAQTRAEVERLTANLQQTRNEGETAASQVSEAQGTATALEQALNDIARSVQEQSDVVLAVEQQLAQTRAEADTIQLTVNERARALYKRQVPPSLSLLSSGSDLEASLDQAAAVQLSTGRDKSDLEGLSVIKSRLDAEQLRYEEELDRLESMETEQAVLLEGAMEVLGQRQNDLNLVREREAALEAQKEDVEADSRELERQIVRRIAQEKAAREAAAAKQASTARAASSSSPSSSSSAASSGSSSPAPRASGGWIRPACGPTTSNFGYRWGRPHQGMDIDGRTGDSLRAANSGVVTSAGWSGGYGNLTTIDHGNGVVTAYAHQSSIGVSSGQRVSRGQVIGRMGATGNVTGDHLHLETRINGRAVDPRQYIPGSC